MDRGETTGDISARSNAASLAQLGLASRLALKLGAHVPGAALADRGAMSDFIAVALAASGSPSHQLASARMTFDRAQLSPPDAGAPVDDWREWLVRTFPPRTDGEDAILAYWQESLAGLRFEAYAGARTAATVPLSSMPEALEDRAVLAQLAEAGVLEGEFLWALVQLDGGIHVDALALCVHWRGARLLPVSLPPIFNPMLLDQGAADTTLPVIASSSDINAAITDLGVPRADDSLTWWTAQSAMVKRITGGALLQGDRTPAGISVRPVLRLFSAQAAPGARTIGKTYALARASAGGTPTLSTLVAGDVAVELDNLLPQKDGLLCASMDRYDSAVQGRSANPLDPFQRRAAIAALALAEGQVQAINGPPGTGKTSLLRAVIASIWVRAAAAAGEPPLVLATGPTNQAVTNIIEAFGEVATPAHLTGRGDITARWIHQALPYGWFAPAHHRGEVDAVDHALIVGGADPRARIAAGLATALAEPEARGGLRSAWLSHFHAWSGRSPSTASAVTDDEALTKEMREAVEHLRSALVRNLQNQGEARAWFDRILCHPALRNDVRGLSEAELAQRVGSSEAELALARGARVESIALASRLTQAGLALEQALSLAAAAPRRWWQFWRNPRVVEARRENAQHTLKCARFSARRLLWMTGWLEVDDDGLPAAIALAIDKAAGQANVLSEQVASAELELEYAREDLRSRAELETHLQENQDQAQETFHGVAAAIEAIRKDASDLAAAREILEGHLDTGLRVQAFHLAARYWEGRWLIAPDRHGTASAAVRDLAQLAPVVVSTFHTLPRFMDHTLNGADLLIVDEAGQAPPEIGAASFALASRALVVGDIHQIQPVTTVCPALESVVLERRGLDLPPSHRLAGGSVMHLAQAATAYTDGLRQPGITLRRHYRCRPSLIAFCDELVYGRVLAAARPPGDGRPLPEWSWIPVAPQVVRTVNGSVTNPAEAESITDWLEQHRLELERAWGSIADSVAVITPFRAQAALLRQTLAERFGGTIVARMVIGTVHALQGAERKAVLFSMVQAAAGRLFVDREGPQLLNVAVSRAQEAFVLFADGRLGQDGAQERPSSRLRKHLERHAAGFGRNHEPGG